ncbi:MAG TPA: hypothetical protein VG944_14450, partial [Fimbriimonas sp.]|nr:hypothetical protein [Fimbriimonas sp.]
KCSMDKFMPLQRLIRAPKSLTAAAVGVSVLLTSCGGGGGGGGSTPKAPTGNLAVKYQAVTSVQSLDTGTNFPFLAVKRTAPPGLHFSAMRPNAAPPNNFLAGLDLYFAEVDNANKITLNLFTDQGLTKSAGSMSMTIEGQTNVSTTFSKYPVVVDLSANVTGGNLSFTGSGKISILDSNGKNTLTGLITMAKNHASAQLNMSLDDTGKIGGTIVVKQNGMTSTMTNLTGDFSSITGDVTVAPQGWTGKATISLLNGSFSETLDDHGKTITDSINPSGNLIINYPDGTSETVSEPLSYTLGTTTGAYVTNPKIAVEWPARSRNLTATSSALSTQISIPGASVSGGTQTFNFDRNSDAGAHEESYTLYGSFYVGSGSIQATFYAEAGENGAVVAVANGTVAFSGSGTTVGSVSLHKDVAKVSVLPVGLTMGQASTQLAFSAKDSSGNILALSPGSAFWTVASGGTKLQVTTDGVATPLAAGSATVKVSVDGVSSSAATIQITKATSSYTAPTALQGPSGFSIWHVTSDGQMVGGADTSALYWSSPTAAPTVLKGLPGSTADYAYGVATVNGKLEIVGSSNGFPVVWTKLTDVPAQLDSDTGYGNESGLATSVNSKGEIVGYATYTPAFYWSSATAKAIVIPGTTETSSGDGPGTKDEPYISETGVISYFIQEGRPGIPVAISLKHDQAPFYAPAQGHNTQFGNPYDAGRYMNGSGLVVATDQTNFQVDVPVYYVSSDGYKTEHFLPALATGTPCEPLGVGDNGWIVGFSGANNAVMNLGGTGVLWKTVSTAVDINTLIPDNTGWTIVQGQFVLSDGSIICRGTQDNSTAPYVIIKPN